MKTRKLAAALMLIPPQMLFATVYYASPDGTGTGESAAVPCSIVNGFTKLNGNAHTLVLAKGRYLLSGPLALSAVQSSTEQTVVMGETGNPADVILDAQGASEVMRINYSCLVTGLTMLNGSNSSFNNMTKYKNSAGGIRISYDGNTFGPSVVSNCVITCCTNTFTYGHKYDNSSGPLSGKTAYGSIVYVMDNGLLVDSIVTNNCAPNYYCGAVLVSSNATVRCCTIAGNNAVNGGAGAFVNYGARNAVFEDCIISNNALSGSMGSGAGLDCRVDGASILVTNCTFVGNTAGLGGGIDAVGNVHVSCVGSRFLNNVAKGQGGGLRLATTASVYLDDCVFDGNRTTDEQFNSTDQQAGGGGVFVQTQSEGGFVGISNCVFRNNFTMSRGGGFGHTWDSSVVGEIVNCVFTNNSSYRQGGGIFLRESPVRYDKPFVVRNSLFALNYTTGTSVSSQGAGLYFASNGNPILDSCTIVSNDSKTASGGIHHRWGGTVTNSVIAFNTVNGTLETGTGWCLLDPNNESVLVPSAYVNSCAWPAADAAFLAANGCINADPRFNDALHGDFSLSAVSPCRDAGVNEGWMTNARDLDGNRRIKGRAVDMGCYESVSLGLSIIVR